MKFVGATLAVAPVAVVPAKKYSPNKFPDYASPNQIFIKKYDIIIIGGGIFGCYAALYLARKGMFVCLIEKEKALFKKASLVNQARLHGGYHYPRSVATALMSDDHKERFTKEHQPFINSTFEKYYAVEKYGSFTDAAQFERFCRFVGIRCELVSDHPLFNYERLEALFLTTEYSFDPVLLGEFYREEIRRTPGIETHLFCKVNAASKSGNEWEIDLQHLENEEFETIAAPVVINATYAASNAINRLFGVDDISLMHEISEIAFVTSPQLQDIGLTVMDGQFGSLMPYGKSGLLSLSSVAYTHHKVSFDNLPRFDCQQLNRECLPEFTANCNTCFAKPASNYRKMLGQIRHYFSEKVELNYLTSMFTIKSKLKANFIDDGRPTEISRLCSNPDYFCIFAGKINSIYEIEKAPI